MTDFTPQHVEPGPIWDSDTIEAQVALAASGSGSYVIPDYAYAVWISTDGSHADEVFVSPDAEDATGISFNSSIKRDLDPFGVEPGTTLHFYNQDSGNAINVNIVVFRNVPS